MTTTDVSELLKRARRDAGWSQRELAARAGTSQPAVARYESGAQVPTLSTLRRLVGPAGWEVVIVAAPAVDRAHLAMAEQIIEMTPSDRLETLARWAALRSDTP